MNYRNSNHTFPNSLSVHRKKCMGKLSYEKYKKLLTIVHLFSSASLYSVIITLIIHFSLTTV